MIPPDVASALRTHLPDSSSATQKQQTQPVAPAQRIADVLSNLVPGQRIFAEVQGMLANGTYRATVAQRDITLALPFAAKAGDSLELEVTETDGKLTLAFVANRSESEAKPGQQQSQSASTSLSNAGKLIGDLMQGLDGEGKRAPAAALNGNQALVSTMPKDAALLAPVLKQALTQSGMFYEAHQARWVAGQLPTEQLRQEPQGKLPAAAQNPQSGSGSQTHQTLASGQSNAQQSLAAQLAGSSAGQAPDTTTGQATNAPANQLPNQQPNQTINQPGNQPGNQPSQDSKASQATTSPAQQTVAGASTTGVDDKPQTATLPGTRAESAPVPTVQTGTGIPREIAPLVQQQLDGLANQNFAWQGQIWPGQKMWWEIGENPEDRKLVGEEATARWHTRLKLSLPLLGGVDARIHLQPGGELGVRILSSSVEGEALLRKGMAGLHQQLESAGLNIRQILIDHDPELEG